MKYILKQFPDRQSWLTWRHTGIGSSDASVIMGMSRFKDINQLTLEKSCPVADEDTSNSYIKERGNRIEAAVRQILEHKFNYPLSPMNIESERFSFLKASLDGINEANKTLIEIKLLSSQPENKQNVHTPGMIKWMNTQEGIEIPEEYYPQIQHQLMITGYEQCMFVGVMEIRGQPLTDDNIAIMVIKRNHKYIKRMFTRHCKFWWDVSNNDYKEDLG